MVYICYVGIGILVVKPKSEVPKSKVPKSRPKGLGLTLKSQSNNQTFKLHMEFTNLDMVKLYFSKTFQIQNNDLGLVFDFSK